MNYNDAHTPETSRQWPPRHYRVPTISDDCILYSAQQLRRRSRTPLRKWMERIGLMRPLGRMR